MNVIKYNVNSGDVCQIGRQYEYGKTQVIFEGYQVIDSANEIYFKFVGRTDDSKYLIPIIDMTLDITQQLTKHVGQFRCQLEEMNTEGTLVSQSPVFYVAVKRSIKVGAAYEVQDPRLETIYQKYNEMYNIISQTNETSLANESQRQAEWITLKQEVADAVASIDGKLDWYKASTTDTLQARLNGFIGEAEGSIQTALETYETQTDSNINDKLTAYQSKTTSDINRMFDDSDRTSKEKIDKYISEIEQRRIAGEFNGSDGYTPVKGKDYFTESEIVQFKKDVTPKKRIDYFTDSEISQIQNEVSSGAIGEFRVVVQTETDNFNTNAANKVSEFDAHTEQIQADISELKSDLGDISDISNNIIDESKITKNIVINTSGVEVANNNYMVSDFVSLKKGDKVTFKSHTETELIGIFAIQAYDSNKNSIGRVKECYSGNIETYTVASDSVAFIRFSIGINTTEPMAVFGETLTPYKPYGFKTAIDTVARNEFELFKTSDKLLFTKDGDSVKIHIPTINGYTFYVFKKWIDTSAFSNVWKLWQYGTSDKSLNTLFASEENIEWEGVVRESDGAYFIGGYHGDETVQTISFLIDGNVYDSTIKNVENMACDSVKIICFSNIFSCADHTTLLFDRYKVLTFNKDGLNISNRWICKSPVSIGIIYPVMMSINRIVDNKNIVEFGRYDDKFVITPLDPNVEAPEGGCTYRSEYAHYTEMWGDNLYAKCVVKNSVLPSPKKYMFVDRTNQSNIAKMYFGYNDTSIPTSFVSGTQIESEAQFVIEKPNVTN